VSEQVGIAISALIVGLVGGVALVGLRRPRSEDRAPSTSHAEQALAAARIQGQLESQAAELRRIADVTAGRDAAGLQLREGLEAARRALEQLQVRDQERRRSEEEHRDVVRRLSTVLAGGASKGRAGENLLREHLRQLPPGMLITDFRVGGKVVEFGLRLPDGRCLPIDSKWTAVAELEALEAADEPAAREAGVRAVERAVALRAREVAQYLDPALTAPVAVAAVPDAAYEALRRAHADAFGFGVVIVPYGSALPIVLFLYALVQRFGDAADVQAGLSEVANVLDVLETVVENKFARAGTMIANGSEEFRSQLGKARGSIARARSAEAGGASSADPASLAVVR
jgi:DNA recombination protein RmuC